MMDSLDWNIQLYWKIATLVKKQISSNSFKNAITYKLFDYKSSVHSFQCVQTNDTCIIVTAA